MVKCDDDTIINMSKYHELMKQQDLSVPFFGGVRFGGMPVFRHGRYFSYFSSLGLRLVCISSWQVFFLLHI